MKALNNALREHYPEGATSSSIPFQWGEYVAPNRPDEIYTKAWWVDAPWAHPFWQSYCIFLSDLYRPSSIGPKEATKYAEGVTHEVVVYALDPDDTNYRVWPDGDGKMPRVLTPPNYIYQFYAASDEAAKARIETIVQNIANGQINPDTDAIRQWEHLFADGVSARETEITLTRN